MQIFIVQTETIDGKSNYTAFTDEDTASKFCNAMNSSGYAGDGLVFSYEEVSLHNSLFQALVNELDDDSGLYPILRAVNKEDLEAIRRSFEEISGRPVCIDLLTQLLLLFNNFPR